MSQTPLIKLKLNKWIFTKDEYEEFQKAVKQLDVEEVETGRDGVKLMVVSLNDMYAILEVSEKRDVVEKTENVELDVEKHLKDIATSQRRVVRSGYAKGKFKEYVIAQIHSAEGDAKAMIDLARSKLLAMINGEICRDSICEEPTFDYELHMIVSYDVKQVEEVITSGDKLKTTIVKRVKSGEGVVEMAKVVVKVRVVKKHFVIEGQLLAPIHALRSGVVKNFIKQFEIFGFKIVKP